MNNSKVYHHHFTLLLCVELFCHQFLLLYKFKSSIPIRTHNFVETDDFFHLHLRVLSINM